MNKFFEHIPVEVSPSKLSKEKAGVVGALEAVSNLK